MLQAKRGHRQGPGPPACVCEGELTLGRQAWHRCVQRKGQEILLSKPSPGGSQLRMCGQEAHRKQHAEVGSRMLTAMGGDPDGRDTVSCRVLGWGLPLFALSCESKEPDLCLLSRKAMRISL